MKKVFLLMAMVLPMVFCGCSKDDEERSLNEYERLFLGTWEEYGNTFGYEVLHIQFNNDGTGFQWAEDFGEVDNQGRTPFTWSATSTQITVSIEGRGTMTMNYIIDGENLFITSGGEGIIYERDNH